MTTNIDKAGRLLDGLLVANTPALRSLVKAVKRHTNLEGRQARVQVLALYLDSHPTDA